MTGSSVGVAGRPGYLRAMNERLLLDVIRGQGPSAVADLMANSSLSKPTVGLTIRRLEEQGLVRAAGPRQGGRGPKAQIYAISPGAGCVLALDVGALFVRGALTDLAGEQLASGSRRVQRISEPRGMKDVVALGRQLLRDAGRSADQVTQTIIGSPGFYSPSTDAMVLSNNLPGWDAPGVIAKLRAAFGERTLVQNDVNLAALAESRRGHGRGVEAFAFLSVGSGVAMGLVIRDQIYAGSHLAAGEIGYLPYALGGQDGRRYTLESQASGRGLVARAEAMGMRSGVTAPEVFAAAKAGDPIATIAVEQEADLVAFAMASISAVIDPALIVLGGGIGRAEGFEAMVVAALQNMIPIAPAVKTSALGDNAVVVGSIGAGLDLAWDGLLAGE